jgi:hypothetical protein
MRQNISPIFLHENSANGRTNVWILQKWLIRSEVKGLKVIRLALILG